jgi:hypothetical protein
MKATTFAAAVALAMSGSAAFAMNMECGDDTISNQFTAHRRGFTP